MSGDDESFSVSISELSDGEDTVDMSVSELELDSRLDLANRYEEMIQRQVENLWNIDTKAWRAARLIGLLIGVFLTGISILPGESGGGISQNLSLAAKVSILGGIALLLVSLFLAMVGILNVKAGYGPNTSLSKAIKNGQVEDEEYPMILSVGLAKSIRMNRRVMGNKADYLRYCFASMYSGIVLLTIGIILPIFQISGCIGIGLVVAGSAAAIFSGYFITSESYESSNSEDEEREETGEEAKNR